VLLTFIIYDRIHQKEVTALRNTNIELAKKRDELSGSLEGMRQNYNQVKEELNSSETKFKELEKQTQAAQAGLNSKISLMTSDLHVCQNQNLNFINEIKGRDASILSLKSQLSDYEKMTAGLKKIVGQKLALEPTWIKGGEPYSVPDADFSMVIDERKENSPCLEDSTAVVNLAAGRENKILCVGMDRPERFKHKRRAYTIDLLGVRGGEGNREYLVSVVK
jgi:hypothetical protein